MSDDRHLLADLLKDDCVANGRRYEMRLSGAREGAAAQQGTAAKAHRATVSLAHAPSPPVRIFVICRERFLPCESRRQVRTHIFIGPSHGRQQSSLPIFFNPEQPA
jgi:hypothetical protein